MGHCSWRTIVVDVYSMNIIVLLGLLRCWFTSPNTDIRYTQTNRYGVRTPKHDFLGFNKAKLWPIMRRPLNLAESLNF